MSARPDALDGGGLGERPTGARGRAGRRRYVSRIGASGSGKSTFLRCINLLELPSSGEIRIGGESVRFRERHGRREPADMRQVERLRTRWLPRALQNVLPTLAGEFVLTLTSTPLAATITVFDVYGVGTVVRQETYHVCEPLLFVAAIYVCLTGVIVVLFRWLESRVPRPA